MKKNKTGKLHNGSVLRTVLALLLVLELLAAGVLSTRLASSGSGATHRISLTEGGRGTTVTVTTGKRGASHVRRMSAYASPAGLHKLAATGNGNDNSDFTARDADKIWQTETEVEIFHVRYDGNGNMTYTVESSSGDKVLAPGTGSEYRFTLENTGEMPLDYIMTFECWMEGSDSFIPVEARLLGGGAYLLGSGDEWTPVEEINDVTEEQTLRRGAGREYTFQWQWPFERSDEEGGVGYHDAEDTVLGNAAVNRDISLHIRIRTVAEISEAPEVIDDPGTPRTDGDGRGRAWALLNLICTILSGLIGIYEFVIFLCGRKENKKAKEYDIYEGEIYTKRIKRRRHKVWDLIPAVGAVIAFILTEDMRLPMIIIDRWSPLMVIILAISVTIALLTKVKRFKKTLEDALEALENEEPQDPVGAP